MQLITQSWETADRFRIRKYVIMPDHIHFFCSPTTRSANLKKWVKYWKSIVSFDWPNSSDKPLWQLDFWDRQIRSPDDYSNKWNYVQANSIRAGLVDHEKNWEFKGEMNKLLWL